MKAAITPPYLRKGDRIAILSPASAVLPEYVSGAESFLRSEGYDPLVFPSAAGPASGSYSAPLSCRLEDLRKAIDDDSIKAILCARGGYGCIHLLEDIDPLSVAANPKWLIGFSDVSALHALWLKGGVCSLHAPMAKHLTLNGHDDPRSRELIAILSGSSAMEIVIPTDSRSRTGKATGKLRGGNLAVLSGLAATPYDILEVEDEEDVILFIEDISEAIYAVERMLMRLYLSGTLRRLRGLIIGQFTDYRPDRNFNTVEEMADSLLHRLGIDNIPIAFGFPVGHVDDNRPLVEGSKVLLEVNPENTILKSI